MAITNEEQAIRNLRNIQAQGEAMSTDGTSASGTFQAANESFARWESEILNNLSNPYVTQGRAPKPVVTPVTLPHPVPEVIRARWMQDQFKLNPSLLIGEGVVYSGTTYQIARYKDMGEDITTTWVYLQLPSFPNAIVARCRLMDALLTRTTSFPAPEDQKDAIKDAFFQRYTKKQEQDMVNIKQSIEDGHSSILNAKRNIEEYQYRIEEYRRLVRKNELLLEQKKKEANPANKILTELEMIRKHPSVEKAFITVHNDVVIYTTNLYRRDSDVKDKRKRNMGKFRIRWTLEKPTIYADNRSYIYDGGHDHPNVSEGTLCTGGNSEEIKEMSRNLDLYALADFVIVFLSTLDHNLDNEDNEMPHVDPYDWWEGRGRHIYTPQEDLIIL